MKSKSTKYAHQSSRSPNLDIPNHSIIGENIAAQARGPTSSCYLILLLLGCGGATIFPSPLGSAIPSYHELLQICIAEVRSLYEVWVKCLASHSICNYRLNWNLHVGPGHSKEFEWTISRVSHIPITTNKWCSGKQHNLVPQVPGSNSCHGKLFLQHFVTYYYTWDSELFMTTWNTLFSKKCLHVGPNWILWRLGTLF
jgi:hypothetical protein